MKAMHFFICLLFSLLLALPALSAPLCHSVFSAELAHSHIEQMVSDSSVWMGRRASQRLVRKAIKSWDQGKLDEARARKLLAAFDKVASSQAFRIRQLLKMDLEGTRHQFLTRRAAEETLIAELGSLLKQQRLIEDQSVFSRKINEILQTSPLRSWLLWGSTHLSANLTSYALLGQFSFIPLYMPHLRLSVRPELVKSYMTDVATQGTSVAFQKMSPELRRSLNIKVGYEIGKRAGNLIILTVLASLLLDLPEEIRKDQVGRVIESSEESLDMVASLLITINLELISDYRERVLNMTDEGEILAIEAEIKRLELQVEQFSNKNYSIVNSEL